MTEKDKLKLAMFDQMLAMLCYARLFIENVDAKSYVALAINQAKEAR